MMNIVDLISPSKEYATDNASNTQPNSCDRTIPVNFPNSMNTIPRPMNPQLQTMQMPMNMFQVNMPSINAQSNLHMGIPGILNSGNVAPGYVGETSSGYSYQSTTPKFDDSPYQKISIPRAFPKANLVLGSSSISNSENYTAQSYQNTSNVFPNLVNQSTPTQPQQHFQNQTIPTMSSAAVLQAIQSQQNENRLQLQYRQQHLQYIQQQQFQFQQQQQFQFQQQQQHHHHSSLAKKYAESLNQSQSHRVLPGSINFQSTLPRPQMPALAIPQKTSLPNYPSIQPQYQMSYAPKVIISFSLINPSEFSVSADNGYIPPETYEILQMFGLKTDQNKKRLIYPLSVHDNLRIALTTKGKLSVEAIPISLLASISALKSVDASAEDETSDTLIDRIPASLYKNLAPFQRTAVKFVLKNDGRAFICDEMGLGKTRSALGAAVSYKSEWPLLVVCPSSAKHHWQNEILSLLCPEVIEPRDITIIENSYQRLAQSAMSSSKIFIISYNLLPLVHDKLNQVKFNVVIADESHYMKNLRAKRTQYLLPILKTSKRCILLSGTPALSRPMELFTQLHALNPTIWSDERAYGRRYCNTSNKTSSNHNSFSEYKGASNCQELFVLLSSTLMIRRLKKDILKQLPKKERLIVQVDIEDSEIKNYFKSILTEIAKKEELASIRSNKRISKYLDESEPIKVDEEKVKQTEEKSTNDVKEEKKNLLMELFFKSGIAKLPSVLRHLDTFLADPTSGKVLIFSHHRNVLDSIVKHCSKEGVEFITIDGKTSSLERQSRSQHFQNSSSCRVAILSITAAGIALTLTAAATVYFAELFWTPGSLIQCEDRAHRIGQINTVKIFYFLADDSIDEILWPLVRNKMRIIGEFTEGHRNSDLASKASAGTSKDPEFKDENIDKEEVIESIEEVAAEIAIACINKETDTTKKVSDEDDNDDEEEQPPEESFEAALQKENERKDRLLRGAIHFLRKRSQEDTRKSEVTPSLLPREMMAQMQFRQLENRFKPGEIIEIIDDVDDDISAEVNLNSVKFKDKIIDLLDDDEDDDENDDVRDDEKDSSRNICSEDTTHAQSIHQSTELSSKGTNV